MDGTAQGLDPPEVSASWVAKLRFEMDEMACSVRCELIISGSAMIVRIPNLICWNVPLFTWSRASSLGNISALNEMQLT